MRHEDRQSFYFSSKSSEAEKELTLFFFFFPFFPLSVYDSACGAGWRLQEAMSFFFLSLCPFSFWRPGRAEGDMEKDSGSFFFSLQVSLVFVLREFGNPLPHPWSGAERARTEVARQSPFSSFSVSAR